MDVEHLLYSSDLSDGVEVIENFRRVFDKARLLILTFFISSPVVLLNWIVMIFWLHNVLCLFNFFNFKSRGQSAWLHIILANIYKFNLARVDCLLRLVFMESSIFYASGQSSSYVATSRRRGHPICLLLCLYLVCVALRGGHCLCRSLEVARPSNCLTFAGGHYFHAPLSGS